MTFQSIQPSPRPCVTT